MLYIRSDANSVIGMGHVARCLSIAEASYQFEGQKPVFLTAEESGRKIIEDRGFEVRVLRTDYRDMEAELGILSGIVQAGDVILVDSYLVTTEYFKKLGKLCRTAYLEDVGVSYPVDLLINYNIYAPKLERYYETAENHPCTGPARFPECVTGWSGMRLSAHFASSPSCCPQPGKCLFPYSGRRRGSFHRPHPLSKSCTRPAAQIPLPWHW